MRKLGDEVHISTEEARGGDTPHILRYVLSISLALAIAAMLAIWLTTTTSERPAPGQAVTAEEHALGG